MHALALTRTFFTHHEGHKFDDGACYFFIGIPAVLFYRYLVSKMLSFSMTRFFLWPPPCIPLDRKATGCIASFDNLDLSFGKVGISWVGVNTKSCRAVNFVFTRT